MLQKGTTKHTKYTNDRKDLKDTEDILELGSKNEATMNKLPYSWDSVKNLWIVLRHEMVTTFQRRSFQYVAFGIPLASLLFFGVLPAVRLWRQPPAAEASAAATAQPEEESLPEGYVDLSGVLQVLPDTIPAGSLVRLATIEDARQALEAGEIESFYLIAEDYLQSGEVLRFQADFNPLRTLGSSGEILQALQYNLLGADAARSQKYNQPLEVQVVRREEPQINMQDNPWGFFLPYSATLLFYIIILMSSSLLLSSITADKTNRVLEVLMASVSTRQLLGGKILGLGLAGLAQAALWLATTFLLLRMRGVNLPFMQDQPLPGSVILVGLLFFLLGYALYASLMASIGALVPNLREASQLTIVLVLPMLVPLLMITILIEAPNEALAVGLSLFPLTAPVTMAARLVSAPVPGWQMVLSGVLMILATIGVLRVAAGWFESQALNAGGEHVYVRVWEVLRKKA